MDIWAWVEDTHRDLYEAGHGRLANLIYQIPNDLHDGHVGRIEACMPEAVAGARALKHPWLEVFFRHWGLRSRLSNLCEGEAAMDESVSLMDFAHQESTLECPQSICVTQDLASCYGNIDGPGWVNERLEVCYETLARIGAERNCFDCLTREVGSALIDGERYQEAFDFLEAQSIKMKQAGNEPGIYYRIMQAELLIHLKQLDQAVAHFEETEKGTEEDDVARVYRRLFKAYLLTLQNNHEAAWDALPAWNELVPGDYTHWYRVVDHVAPHLTTINNWNLGRVFQQGINHFKQVGAYRLMFEAAVRHARLSIRRQAWWVAAKAIEDAEYARSRLRIDAGAKKQLLELQATISQNPQIMTLPVGIDELVEYLANQESPDPEQDIEYLLVAKTQGTENSQIYDRLAMAMEAMGAITEAKQILSDYMEQHPESADQVVFSLMSLLDKHKHEGALNDLVEILGQQTHMDYPARHGRMLLAKIKGDMDALIALSTEGIEKYPHDIGLKRAQVFAYQQKKDYPNAMHAQQRLVDTLLQTDQEVGQEVYAMLCAYASAAQDWARAREAALAFGFTFAPEDNNPTLMEGHYGMVWLKYFEDGDTRYHLAQRTGPTTARVVSVAPRMHTQHVRDEVVFEPFLAEPAPEDPQEREKFIPVFDVMHTLRMGNYQSWLVDGPHPGEEHLNALYAACDNLDWAVWVGSREYEVKDPERTDDNAMLPGLFFQLGVPATQGPQDVAYKLKELTKQWPYPVCWLSLAEAAGLDEDFHRVLVEQYDL